MRPRIGITSAAARHAERPVDRLSRWYVDAVARAGGLPLILPTLAPTDAEEMLAGLDGVVLSGGGDVSPFLYGEEPAPEVYDVDAKRDEWELALIAAAAADFPVLGVCRGAQLLNVAAGGSLIQHLPNVTTEQHRDRDRDREAVHTVDIAPESRLAEILGVRRLGVNTVHHQAIDRVGAGLRPVAWAPDGIIEAVERTDGALVVAVQWHPESLIDMAPHVRLFLWLTAAAARRRPGLEVPARFTPTVLDAGPLDQVIDDVA
jgi:putative glutamine amidotransferase